MPICSACRAVGVSCQQLQPRWSRLNTGAGDDPSAVLLDIRALEQRVLQLGARSDTAAPTDESQAPSTQDDVFIGGQEDTINSPDRDSTLSVVADEVSYNGADDPTPEADSVTHLWYVSLVHVGVTNLIPLGHIRFGCTTM